MKQTSFASLATSIPHAIKVFQWYSSPVEALNLIVVSKSLSVEVNNSADNLAMSHICPLRR